jgi:hypothetical protein
MQEHNGTTKPTLKRKRQPCACDGCRKSKKRCDGKSPCARCKESNRSCTYSHSKKKFLPEDNLALSIPPFIPPLTLGNEDIRKFIERYLKEVYPLNNFGETDQQNFMYPTTSAHYFQSYSIAATALRSLGNKEAALQYESYAKELARELFDDFTVDTALGFSLLSFHFWPSDRPLSVHYRNITLSICRHLRSQNISDQKYLDSVLKVEVSVMSYDLESPSTFPQPIQLSPLVREALTQMNDYHKLIKSSSLELPALWRFLEFRNKYVQLVLVDISDSLLVTQKNNIFKRISQLEASELLIDMQVIDRTLSKRFSSSGQWPHVCDIATIRGFEAVILYASGDYSRAVYHLEIATKDCLRIPHLAQVVAPCTLDAVHQLFMVSIYLDRLDLAEKLVDLQLRAAQELELAYSYRISLDDKETYQNALHLKRTIPKSLTAPAIEDDPFLNELSLPADPVVKTIDFLTEATSPLISSPLISSSPMDPAWINQATPCENSEHPLQQQNFSSYSPTLELQSTITSDPFSSLFDGPYSLDISGIPNDFMEYPLTPISPDGLFLYQY